MNPSESAPPYGGPARIAAAVRRACRSFGRAAGAIVLAVGLVGGAAAQSADPPPLPPPAPEIVPNASDPSANLGVRTLVPNAGEPAFGGTDEAGLPAIVAPYAPPDAAPDIGPGLDLGAVTPQAGPRLVLSARLTEDGAPLRSGMVWRVFGAEPGPDGQLPLVANAAGGSASFDVTPGAYLVYGGFGHAGTTVRVEVKGGLREENVVLNAGGLRLRAATDDKHMLPAEDIRFDVLSMETDERGERKVVARDVKPDQLVRLAADTYHVVSRYGLVNAQTRGDVEVTAGKLTEVTLFQRAAEVTLKLVGSPGGEAIADTKWSVLTPGGDIVTEGVGAFPSFVLASGEYTVVARHNDKVFQRNFDVETGRDAEVEVLAQE